MDLTIVRKAGMTLELWVKDLGDFDPYRIFMDGVQVDLCFETERHYGVPDDATTVMVQFEGGDGGASAMIDAQTPPVMLGKQTQGRTQRFKIIDG